MSNASLSCCIFKSLRSTLRSRSPRVLRAGEAPSAAMLDCKASTGKLFVPEDTTAVVHGDQNLAISDFLSRVNV